MRSNFYDSNGLNIYINSYQLKVGFILTFKFSYEVAADTGNPILHA